MKDRVYTRQTLFDNLIQVAVPSDYKINVTDGSSEQEGNIITYSGPLKEILSIQIIDLAKDAIVEGVAYIRESFAKAYGTINNIGFFKRTKDGCLQVLSEDELTYDEKKYYLIMQVAALEDKSIVVYLIDDINSKEDAKQLFQYIADSVKVVEKQ